MNTLQIGTWAEMPSAYVTNVMAKAGFDFSIIDMEHGTIDFGTAQDMVFAAHAEGRQAYIRVPAIEESWTTRTLDTGCDGIIFPQVKGVADAKEAVRLCCFAPEGERGFNPFVPAGGYHKVSADYFEKENRRIKIGLILEGKEAFSQLDEILKIPQVSILYVGQYDLSIALGIPGDVGNQKVLDLMALTAGKASAAGKSAGCMVHSVQEAKDVIAQGFSFVVYKVDCGILYDCIHDFTEGVRHG
jgi:4-hydroxy-2-oxoheptanedioate aldolase